MKAKNYISVTVETDVDVFIPELLPQISDAVLLEECEKRKLTKSPVVNLEPKSPDEIKRLLCDIAGMGYLVSNESVLNRIARML